MNNADCNTCARQLYSEFQEDATHTDMYAYMFYGSVMSRQHIIITSRAKSLCYQ